MNHIEKQQYETFIFDLDGTLLNSLADLTDAVNHTLRHFDMPLHSDKEVRSYLGNGFRQLLIEAAPAETSETLIDKMLAVFKPHYEQHSMDKTRPYEQIIDTLQQLKASGKKMAIVSNKGQDAVSDLVAHFFGQLISVAVGETSTVRRKPAPDTLLYAMQALGASKESTCFVGDSEVDLQAARHAHLPCLTCLWGYRDKDDLIEAGAEHLLESPHDILAFS